MLELDESMGELPSFKQLFHGAYNYSMQVITKNAQCTETLTCFLFRVARFPR